MPIDSIDMPAVLDRVQTAATVYPTPFLISTPNLNFLVASQSDREFRDSLLLSDLCPPDGMPIVWLARLMGLPVKARIAGSDIFDALKAYQTSARPLKVFFFGGPEGVAAAACRALNAVPCGLTCVGSTYPGFGSVDDMSRDEIIAEINASNADFLVVALGAQKGQLWLLRNHWRLRIPIRAHFGAAISFQAGTITRAPARMRTLGAEWLWRIREEPHLWRRYWQDGSTLLRLIFIRVVPLIIWARWIGLTVGRNRQDLTVGHLHDGESLTLPLKGFATVPNAARALSDFHAALLTNRPIIIDLSETRFIDARFLGLLLMLRKCLKERCVPLKFVGASARMTRLLRLHGAQYLLTCNQAE